MNLNKNLVVGLAAAALLAVAPLAGASAAASADTTSWSCFYTLKGDSSAYNVIVEASDEVAAKQLASDRAGENVDAVNCHSIN